MVYEPFSWEAFTSLLYVWENRDEIVGACCSRSHGHNKRLCVFSFFKFAFTIQPHCTVRLDIRDMHLHVSLQRWHGEDLRQSNFVTGSSQRLSWSECGGWLQDGRYSSATLRRAFLAAPLNQTRQMHFRCGVFSRHANPSSAVIGSAVPWSYQVLLQNEVEKDHWVDHLSLAFLFPRQQGWCIFEPCACETPEASNQLQKLSNCLVPQSRAILFTRVGQMVEWCLDQIVIV